MGDLDRAASEGVVGHTMYDLARVTLLVAALDPADCKDAPRLIANAGAEYKWMDSTHVLVVLRASGGAAVRKAAELAAKVRGVVSWMPFYEWRGDVPAAVPLGASTVSDDHDRRKSWGLRFVAVGASSLFFFLALRSKVQLSVVRARLLRKWRYR